MVVLALDTTTRAGSVALARDDSLIETFVGDASATHAARLPGDILVVLARHGMTLADIDLFSVAAGPGSFTGLRIGIATIQGLAFANNRPVAAVSALEALAHSVDRSGQRAGATEEHGFGPARNETSIGAWMDARRGEVYAALFRADSLEIVHAAVVDEPGGILDRWSGLVSGQGEDLLLLGDGALAFRQLIAARLPRAAIAPEVPMLAPAIARLALRAAGQGLAGPPHAIQPIYVRRPDAELARERGRRHLAGRKEEHNPHG
jgi:tRNA threonylcarbamoyladenosine biosynthesis protein TsaB